MLTSNNLLSWIVFTPLLGAALILLVPKSQANLMRWLAVAATAVTLLLTLIMLGHFDQAGPGITEFQLVVRRPWIESFSIQYYLGIDGISVPLVILTGLLSFLCVVASWKIERWVKAYMALFLLLETGMMGVFCSLDMFLFYVFWEVMLLPMYFLIGIWGGPRREYAAIKFFLYTLLGSVLMLLGILALYFASEPHTFSLPDLILTRAVWASKLIWVPYFWKIVFVAFFIGFAIKVPIFPFHTWLPDAHVEAPTAISVILAGVLLKMGTYGILRVNFPLFPEAAHWFAPCLLGLGVINIVYGSLCAMAQKDLKKLVAYSSVGHMGYCVIAMAAMTSQGFHGAVLQMWNHGIITGMLFLLVGVVYDRAHHRDIDGFGGLATVMPIYAGFVSLAFMASLGLPGLAGFVSEALCFLGTWPVYPIATAISVSGVVLGAAYFLWAYQRIFFGPLNPKYEKIPEINAREIFTLAPLAVLTLFVGVYPMPIFHWMTATLNHLQQILGVSVGM
jgi:NADH-quinone oxidoreductase subunit M